MKKKKPDSLSKKPSSDKKKPEKAKIIDETKNNVDAVLDNNKEVKSQLNEAESFLEGINWEAESADFDIEKHIQVYPFFQEILEDYNETIDYKNYVSKNLAKKPDLEKRSTDTKYIKCLKLAYKKYLDTKKFSEASDKFTKLYEEINKIFPLESFKENENNLVADSESKTNDDFKEKLYKLITNADCRINNDFKEKLCKLLKDIEKMSPYLNEPLSGEDLEWYSALNRGIKKYAQSQIRNREEKTPNIGDIKDALGKLGFHKQIKGDNEAFNDYLNEITASILTLSKGFEGLHHDNITDEIIGVILIERLNSFIKANKLQTIEHKLKIILHHIFTHQAYIAREGVNYIENSTTKDSPKKIIYIFDNLLKTVINFIDIDNIINKRINLL